MKTEIERFWGHVKPSGGCLVWQRARDKNGYGLFKKSSPDAKMVRAHRYAYQASIGPIPEGLVLDHLCRNPPCVNPTHLEPVTNRENILRGDTEPAKNARKTHCNYGHPFDEQNTVITRDGFRDCLACRRRRYAARWLVDGTPEHDTDRPEGSEQEAHDDDGLNVVPRPRTDLTTAHVDKVSTQTAD